MENVSNKKSYWFYSISIMLAAVFVSGLLYLLSWPLMAELPLGLATFIQLIAFARYLFKKLILPEKVSWDKIKNTVSNWVGTKKEKKQPFFEMDVSEDRDRL